MDPKMIGAASYKNKEKENAVVNNAKVVNNNNKGSNNRNGSNHLYNNKADIWSLGVIVYRMLMGLLPFSGKSWNDLFSSIKDRMFVLPYNKSKIELTKGAIKFIDKLLNIDMNKRPTAKELMKDKWLNNSLSNEDKSIMVIKSESEIALEKEASLLLFENYWKVKNETQSLTIIHGNTAATTTNKKTQIKKDSRNRFLLIDGLLERLGRNGNNQHNQMQIIFTDNANNEHNNDKIISNRYLSPSNNKKSNNNNNKDTIDDPGTPIKEDNHIYSYSKHIKHHK
jgi:serine/threonine protein kinase